MKQRVRGLMRVVTCIGMCALAGCAGKSAYREGVDLFAQGNQEAGLARLEQAMAQAPDNPVYRMTVSNARKRIIARLLGDAQREKVAGRLDAAEAVCRRALKLEADNAGALAALAAVEQARRHAGVMAEAKTLLMAGNDDAAERLLAKVLEENRGHEPARLLLRQIEERGVGARSAVPALRDSFRKPITLEFRDANLKQVLEAMSRHSGLNFIVDKDIPPSLQVTVFLREISLAEALDVLLTTNQLRQRVLSDNTVLIYPDTVAKQGEHQDLVVKNVFLANAEAKQVATMLKTVLKMRNVFSDDKLNLLMMRDTPATIRLAERLVSTQDVAEPEVMLEVAVVEVTRSQLTNLGMQFPSQLTLTPLPSSGTTLTLDDLQNLSSKGFGAAISPFTLNLQDDAGVTNLLANPSIRTHNREKAQIRIGDRVPVITTTATSTGFLSESVQYVDVGLKLEVEPTIYPGDEVSIKLALEVSSVVKEVLSKAGSISYQIGGRSASTVLRLKDGETQILGGLINDEDRRSANRFPGLSQFPLIGRLFASETDNNQKTELVLSITPRIVRGLAPPVGVPAEFWSGSENNPRLVPPVTLPPVAPPPASPSSPSPITPPATPPIAPQAAAVVPAPALVIGPLIRWNGPSTVKTGENFRLALEVSSDVGITDFPLQIKYDKDVFELQDTSAGAFMTRDSAATDVGQRLVPRNGMIYLNQRQRRAGEAGRGALGNGNLAEIGFRALKASAGSRVTVLATDPLGVGGRPLGQVGPTTIDIRVAR